jgi:hypothetical protein
MEYTVYNRRKIKMYKEKLFEIVEHNCDKITYEQYVKLICRLGEMKEEDCKNLITEQGSLTPYRKATHSAIGIGSTAAGAIATGGVSLAGYPGYRILKAIFSKCARQCGIFGWNSPKRQECLAKCKEEAKQAASKGKEPEDKPVKIL